MEDMYKQMKIIQDRLKKIPKKQKSYAKNRTRDLQFEVGNKVFLKLIANRGIPKQPRGEKLSLRFV